MKVAVIPSRKTASPPQPGRRVSTAATAASVLSAPNGMIAQYVTGCLRLGVR